MQWLLAAVTALHVLPATFWAGSTFALTRTGGAGLARLVRPQLGAGAATIVMGAVLGALTHRGGFGPSEQVLALGAVCALAAFAVQASAVPQLRKLQTANGAPTEMASAPLLVRQRIAAGLLAVALVSMAAARFI